MKITVFASFVLLLLAQSPSVHATTCAPPTPTPTPNAHTITCTVSCSASDLYKILAQRPKGSYRLGAADDFEAYCKSLGGRTRLGIDYTSGGCGSDDNTVCVQAESLQFTANGTGKDLYEARQAARGACWDRFPKDNGQCTTGGYSIYFPINPSFSEFNCY